MKKEKAKEKDKEVEKKRENGIDCLKAMMMKDKSKEEKDKNYDNTKVCSIFDM